MTGTGCYRQLGRKCPRVRRPSVGGIGGLSKGRSDALKRFLIDDGIGKEARFWKLAQSLSALYPPGTDEKRWVDGVLARKKGLGL